MSVDWNNCRHWRDSPVDRTKQRLETIQEVDQVYVIKKRVKCIDRSESAKKEQALKMSLNMDDDDMEPLMGILDQHGFDLRDDDDQTPYTFRCQGVTIKYEGLKTEYFKVHKKIPKQQLQQVPGVGGKGSWMRVKDGQIKILVENKKMTGIPIVKVVVQRERAAYAEARQMNEGDRKIVRGDYNIPFTCEQRDIMSWSLSLDLDSIYMASEDGHFKEVYALCPSNIDVTNKFQLVTEVYVRRLDEFGKQTDTLIGRKESVPFLLRTEPRNAQNGKPSSPATSNSSAGSPQQLELQDASYNNLQAVSADIRTLNAKVIKTPNRDIGYHIPLKDLGQKGDLKEGDVVVFLEDDRDKTVIERLSEDNFKRAKLAGVITRSFYVEGVCPETKAGESDLVCVIGIVKVRVLGPVSNGEQLYAYPKRPGVAATNSTILLDKKDKNDKLLLLGQALESRRYVGLQDESLVPSFVSVVNGIDCLAMTQKVSDLHDQFQDTIKRSVGAVSKKMKRRFFWLKLLMLIILATIGLALWQRYAPNTLLRQSICKRGSLDGHTAIITFNTSWQEITITALEYKFHDLRGKLNNKSDLKKRKGEDTRYFINYQRCCNRGISYGNKYVDDTPTVAGPEVLSIDGQCTPQSVMYLNEGHWAPLQNAKRNIKIKNCHGTL